MTYLARVALAAVLAAVPAASTGAAPAPLEEFASVYCSGCHGGEQPAGKFRIDAAALDFGEPDQRERWQRAVQYVSKGVMPPAGASQPPPQARERFAAGLRGALAGSPSSGHSAGGLVRRLNRIEYLNTLRDLFQIREIRLPVTFPDDSSDQRFDTMARGTYLTPGHLDAYHEVAVDIADRIVPLPGLPLVESLSVRTSVGQDPARTKYWLRDGDESGLYFTGVNIAGWSGALWDRAFVAPASGVYRVRLLASAEASAGADGKPLQLGFYALNPADYDLPKRALRVDLPRVGSLEVENFEPEVLEAEVHLEAGENFQVYCENRLRKQYPHALLRRKGFTQDLRRLLATYLDEAQASPEPTIRFERMEIAGPVRPLPRQEQYLRSGEHPDGWAYLEAALLPLAERAFRRPLTEGERTGLVRSALEHAAGKAAPEYGVHFGIRRILLSPQFLFRETGQGDLDDFDIASRLSYFLWSSMPDAELLRAAAAGELAGGAGLRFQLGRMVRDPRAGQFVRHFSGQWLGNRKAASVMVCDVRHVWSELIRYGIVRSTEMFFDEILQRNLGIRTFIDSDFTYANEPMRIAWGIPGSEVDLRRLEADQRQSLLWPEPERLDLTTLGDDVPEHVAGRGGVLGLSSVFAATGDGVESSPVLRGVWVLDNLFGTPPPPPPSDVPALVADTSQARTVREILAAHQRVESCAVCHAAIDPIGLALENYDAVGGWRTSYYREESSSAPAHSVEAAAEMEDGTRLEGASDLKKYLMQRPRILTKALAGLLVEYAAGRELTATDKRVVDEIAAAEPADGYGLQDLLVAVVESAAFLEN